MNADFIAKLRKARALVKRGWMQGAWSNWAEASPTVKRYCAWGALIQVGLDENYVVEVPGEERLQGAGGLSLWNDEKGRTQAEVIACFDNSIAALEYAESGVTQMEKP